MAGAVPDQIGKCTSVAVTIGATTTTFTEIQSYGLSDLNEIVDFLNGDANVKTHYQGPSGYQITFETSDISKFILFRKGMLVTAATIIIDATYDASGDDITNKNLQVVLSHGIISEMGEFGRDNADRGPAVGSITVELSRHPSATSDPTVTFTQPTS